MYIKRSGLVPYCTNLYSKGLKKPGKRHAMHAHRQEAVSDWLNPHSLGTMSALGYIENLS